VAALAAHRPLPGLRNQDHGQPSRAYLLLRRAGELPVSDLDRRQFSTGLSSRQASRDLMATRREGIVRTARVQAAAHVTRVALQEAGLLSAMEAELIRQAPLGEMRYQAIADAFAQLAMEEIVRMGWV
jgi:DNA-binding transcriptional ArsR family regulator